MKLKTRKAAAKRVKKKKTHFARKQAYTGHLLRRKTTKQLRTLNQPAQIHDSDFNRFSRMLPYA
jgi:large subunit ribosomal protein L35|uniref:50S ribosomal protein L35 n=1 Tax=Ochromonas sp. CCMP1393 TaxID=420556 RepID=A0A0D3MKD2_9STRA|nr:50S ribosomal protein L35 [Ochromonas sp. CCMP1393]